MKTQLIKQFNRSSARILTRGRIPFFAFLVILATGSFALADATYDDNSLPAANIVTGSSGVGNVTIDISGTKSYGYVISGNGTLTKTGSGELTLTKQNTVSGGVTVNNGTLTLKYTGGTGALPKGSVITVDGSTSVLQGSGTILGYGTGGAVGRLNLNNGGSINVTSGHITMGCVIYLNDGKLTIANPTDQGDNYGNYIIDNGIHVTGGKNNEIAANKISIRNDGHAESGGFFDVAENAQLTVKAVIFDSPFDSGKRPNVIKKGKGVLVFSAANTYSKDTSIEAGTIRLINNGTLGNATSDITVKSSAEDMWATLEFAQTEGTVNFSRNINSLYYSNAASGGINTGRLIKSGAATLNLTKNISSTGVETTAGTINFGTETTPNGNALRPGYLSISNSTVNYYGGTNGTMTILAGGYSFVGKTGNGSLNINSGSVKTETNGPNKGYLKMYIAGDGNASTGDNSTVGTVNIASGATYAAGSEEINVGNWGKGSINIYGTMTSSALLRLAEHTGSQGAITIYDGGSLTSNTNLFVGSYGTGLVDVKNGGSVTAKGSVTIGSYGDGAILVESGGSFVSTVNIKLAEHTTNSGTITVKKGGSLKSQDIQVGAWGTGIVNNYGTIEVTDTVKIGRDGSNGSGTVNVYKDATLSANIIYPGVTMPGTLNVNGGTVTATDIAMHGRGANATGTILITDGGSVTANLLQFGNAGYQSYAVDTTLTLDNGTLSVVNVNYPRDGAYTNKVNATVNLGKGTVITGANPGVESIWWRAVHINLTSADGTYFQVDEGKQSLINSSMSGNGKLIKTGEGTLLINAAQGAVDIQRLVVSSGRLDMKEYLTGALEVGLPDADNSTVIFSPGNSVGSLEITGDFTLHKGATLLMEFDDTGTDSLLVSGTTTFEEGSILSLAMGDGTSISPNQQISFQLPIGIDAFDNAILDYPSFLTNLEYNSTTGVLSATVDANAVPEPSTWALLVLGVVVLFLRKRVRS